MYFCVFVFCIFCVFVFLCFGIFVFLCLEAVCVWRFTTHKHTSSGSVCLCSHVWAPFTQLILVRNKWNNAHHFVVKWEFTTMLQSYFWQCYVSFRYIVTGLCDHSRAGALLRASIADERDCLEATELCGDRDLDVSLGTSVFE